MEYTKVNIGNAKTAIGVGNKALNEFSNKPSPFANHEGFSFINEVFLSGNSSSFFLNYELANKNLGEKTGRVLSALDTSLGNMESLSSEQADSFKLQGEELVKFSGAKFTGIDGKEVDMGSDGKLDVVPDLGTSDSSIETGVDVGGSSKPSLGGPGGGNPGGGDTGGGNPGGGNTGGEEEKPPLVKVNNKILQEKEYDKIELEGLLKIHAAILAHVESKKMTISDLLFDPKNALELKELMLANPNISKELKELIAAGDDDITYKILSEIFMGKNKEMFGINGMTSGTIKNYLTTIADENDVSLNKLLTDTKYDKDVRDAIKDYENAANYLDNIKDSNQKTEYLKIYDGDSIERVESTTVNIVRDSLEVAAGSARKTVVEFLESAKLTDHTTDISNSSKLLGIANSFNTEKMYELLNKIIK